MHPNLLNKIAKGCACVEIEREKLEIDKEYRFVKPTVILDFYEQRDMEYYYNLVDNCKCFEK